MKIIVASSNPTVYERVGKILEGLSSHEVYRVKNVAQLLINIIDHDYDLLILDDGLNGFVSPHVLSIIRKTDKDLPIVLIEDERDLEEERLLASSGINFRIMKESLVDGVDFEVETYQKAIRDICTRRKTHNLSSLY
jgi:DNA-binding response OmpR family regulator